MSRSSAEIKEVVRELKDGFSGIQEAGREFRAQLYREESYTKELAAALDDQITTRIPFPSRRLDIAAWQTEGILNQSLSFHVEPASTLTRDDKRADRLELFKAHLWSTQLDRGGKVSRPTFRGQGVQPFVAWWLEWDPFNLPEDDSKRKSYRESYAPFHLSVVDWESTYFLPDDDGMPTVCGREFEMPVIEVLRRYGKDYSRDKALQILGEQFPGLRGGRGQTADESTLFSKKAKVWVSDDQEVICHAVELDDGTYQQVGGEKNEGKDIPNPWNHTSLFVVTGRYNADAQKLENRYEGLLWPLRQEQRSLDILKTHIASNALNATRWGVTVPPEAATALILDDKAMPTIEFKDGVASLPGDVNPFAQPLDGSVAALLEHQLAERDAALPAPYLTNPDQTLVKAATAAAQLNAHETSNRSYDSARASYISAIVEVNKAIDYFISHEGYLGKMKEGIHVRLNGKEPTSIYSGDRKGEDLDITADDLDFPYTLEVEIVASTQSQKALEFELEQARVAAGVGTWESLAATVTEDVTGLAEKVHEEKRFQMLAPVFLKMDLLEATQTILVADGIDMSPYLMASGLMGESGPQQQEPVDNGVGGSRTDAPATNPPEVGVMA